MVIIIRPPKPLNVLHTHASDPSSLSHKHKSRSSSLVYTTSWIHDSYPMPSCALLLLLLSCQSLRHSCAVSRAMAAADTSFRLGQWVKLRTTHKGVVRTRLEGNGDENTMTPKSIKTREMKLM